MAKTPRKPGSKGATGAKVFKTVEAIRHNTAKRKNIPTAEYGALAGRDVEQPVELRYPRNPDLDPQLVWRGKDQQNWSDLVVNAPALYIQEKVHPKVLIDDLQRETGERAHRAGDNRWTFSLTSTAFLTAWTRPSSTSTTRTGRTG